jgi:hypothetical protein
MAFFGWEPENETLGFDDLPIVGEWRDCLQLSETEWQGTDVATGQTYRVSGGQMPDFLAVAVTPPVGLPRFNGMTTMGRVRLVRE